MESETHAGPPSTLGARAASAVPHCLERQRFAEHLDQLLHEYAPAGPTERELVRDMARHAAAAERWAEAAEAVERRAVQSLPGLLPALPSDSDERGDALLAAAMASDGAERCERLALAHSRAFFRLLKLLRELQQLRKTAGEDLPPASPFRDEAACTEYLIERWRCGPSQRCANCGTSRPGYVVPAPYWPWACIACWLVEPTPLIKGIAMKRYVSGCWCVLLLTALGRGDDGTRDAIARLRSVGKEGAGNVQAAQALRDLQKIGPAALVPLLAAFENAPPAAAQWLGAAVDLIAEQALQDRQPLPMDKLTAFLAERKHAGRARLLAFEWLCRADPMIAPRLLPDMLDDPCLELRRAAVGHLIQETETKKALVEQITAYRRALTAARDKDQAEHVIAALDGLGVKTDRAAHFGFIRDWQLLGPFDNPKGNNFDHVFPPEQGIDLKATYTGKGERKLTWQPIHVDDDEGHLDLAAVLGKDKEVIAYALAIVHSDKPTPVDVRAASNNAVQIFLNGKRIYSRKISHQGRRIDQHQGSGQLVEGDNQILIKVCLDDNIRSSAQWSFQLRVCDALGGAVPVKIRPVANQKGQGQ
ncbi:MAG: hypothetical protein AB7K24_18480 [Gemmataceae bacterium]